MSISSIGVGSGIDLEGLVDSIIVAEREPVTNRLNLLEGKTQATISAFGSLKSTVSAFQTALSKLKSSATFDQRIATGDSSKFTVTAASTAEIGSHTISMGTLAQANKIATQSNFTNPSATVGSGTLTIGFVGGDSFDISVVGTDSLSDLKDAINNATDNIGVTASLLTVDKNGDGNTVTELVLTSDNTGADYQLDISVVDDGDGNHTDASGLSRFFHDGNDPTDDAGNQMDQVDAAQNARITVDGFTAYSSTNKFSDVISGVTITALVDDGEDGLSLDPPTATLDISLDKTTVKSAIEVFVASYNELVTVINQLGDYDAATETRGLLSGDSTLNNLETQVRRIFSGAVEGAAEGLNTLSTLGISTNTNGSVTLDSDELDSIIKNQFADISALFSGDNGIASRLDSLLENYLSAGGIFQSREERFQTELNEVEDERANLEFRLEKIEARLRAQFASLDILVSQLNSTGNFLSQQLTAAADIINYKK